jgi:hypothetical protein
MRTFLLLLPAALGLLALGAHFLRRGEYLYTLACLAVLWLLRGRRRSSVRWIQLVLALGAVEWLRTLAILVPQRRAAGEPTGRLVAILGGVALLSVVGALLLETPALRRRFAPDAAPAPPPPASPVA